jgi:hypothetical protein
MPAAPYRSVRCVPAALEPYRYLLEIALAPGPSPGPRLTVIMKNPSTASETRSDPTIGKVEAWARRRGFGTLAVVNLFALRTPFPAALNAPPYAASVGPGNDVHIRACAACAEVVVAGWGNPNGIRPDKYERRIAEVLRLLNAARLSVVGPLTRQGHPRHGLVWNGSLQLIDWR